VGKFRKFYKGEIEIYLPDNPANSCELAKTTGVKGIEATVIVLLER
jgi:hypothetical protein